MHRAVVRGLPVSVDKTDAAIAYARSLRSYTLTGISCLLGGLVMAETAVTYASGTLDWLRWLIAAGSLTFGAYGLFIGHRARRMISFWTRSITSGTRDGSS
jgi:hypothetical protein